MPEDSISVEPWLRGTRQHVPVLARAVLHALDLAREDCERWTWPLPAEKWEERPFGLPSVAFQMRHMARSLDRLLTYAEGKQLSLEQHTLLRAEHDPQAPEVVRDEFVAALHRAEQRVLALPLAEVEGIRYVGRARLPVTLAGLLVHVADHTQRHAGQAVTTAKVLLALREAAQSCDLLRIATIESDATSLAGTDQGTV